MNLKSIFNFFILFSSALVLLVFWSATQQIDELIRPSRVDSNLVKRQWEDMMGINGFELPLTLTLLDKPEALGIGYREFDIESEAGKPIQCWYFNNVSNPNAITVLILHDVGEGKLNYLDHVRSFHDRGFRVVLADLRAHGYSGGDVFEPGRQSVMDVRLLLDSIYSWPETVNCSVLGVGVGALVAAEVALADDRPHALILQSPVATLDTLVEYEFENKWGKGYRWLLPVVKRNTLRRMGVGEDAFSIGSALATLDIPIMFVTGTADMLAPATKVLELYNLAISPRKELWFISGAGHNDADEVGGDAYYNRLSIFMVKSFPLRTNKSRFKKLV